MQYDQIRGKTIEQIKISYWDMVVITAADHIQKLYFENVIKYKQSLKVLPDIPIYVFSDGESIKIGTGLATLKAIFKLANIYNLGQVLRSKILMIHSGGYSQRLPHYSLIGKIFMPLTIENYEHDSHKNYQYDLLDFKLAIFIPLIPFMFSNLSNKGGIMITCADDIQVYQLNSLSITTENKNPIAYDILCLAHPSSIQIGMKHGVFALKSLRTFFLNHDAIIEKNEIYKILQKPSKFDMMKEHAILFYNNSINSLEIKHEGYSNNEYSTSNTLNEIVFTDSSFVIGPQIVSSLYNLVLKEKDFSQAIMDQNEEIDCYVDFLQSNFAIKFDSLLYSTTKTLKIKLHEIFKECDIKIFVLMKSKFFHLGTLPEILDAYCLTPIILSHSIKDNLPVFPYLNIHLANALHFKPIVNCYIESSSGQNIFHSIPDLDINIKRVDSSRSINNSLILGWDCLEFDLAIDSPRYIIEFCSLFFFDKLNVSIKAEKIFKLNGDNILSHVEFNVTDLLTHAISAQGSSFIPTIFDIPPSTLWFTYPVDKSIFKGDATLLSENQEIGYVTFCFGIEDDIKMTSKFIRLLDYSISYLKYLGKFFYTFLDNTETPTRANITLWDLKIFPICKNPTFSFIKTYNLVISFLKEIDITHLNRQDLKSRLKRASTYLSASDAGLSNSEMLVSMNDICKNKHATPFLSNYRNSLLQNIRQYLKS
ncbi:fucose-1-phosphate guanylyltransferase-like isoform X1 [Gordionus sp. m RMFG-2023]|uniref:fucose-1-phosphate guanylyltransferase-like isoform X1 n=3 Tax=Gordionus sp. m RMFG-2023 TaxID=3053472 RepID=UPI0031FCE092